MSRALQQALHRAGFFVTTVAEHRRRGQSDAQQLEFAASMGWTLFTFNVGDFARLHVEWLTVGREHPGIVVETNQYLGAGELA